MELWKPDYLKQFWEKGKWMLPVSNYNTKQYKFISGGKGTLMKGDMHSNTESQLQQFFNHST